MRVRVIFCRMWIGIGWTATWTAILALVGYGMNGIGYSPPDFVLARGCFVSAGIALIGMTTMWLSKSRWSLLPKVLGSLGLYALAVVWLAGSLIYVGNREAAAQLSPGNNPGGASVGHDNNGNLCTSGATCNFNSPPPNIQPHSEKIPSIGNNNTVVNSPIPPSMGNGNTFVGPTDSHANAIYNQGGTAIGNGACASPTGVAIGAYAGGGCTPKQ
jgi:hypothetical protein